MIVVLFKVQIVLLALIPSLLWLAFYLREDVLTEPKTLLILTFLGGALITPVAALLERGLKNLAGVPEAFGTMLLLFLAAAFIEEMAKYLIVRWGVIENPAFDEPTDGMIYLIVAALGFAAAENIHACLTLAQNINLYAGNQALQIQLPIVELLGLRFLGATLLHTLSSGIVGYYLSLQWFHIKTHGRHFRKFLVLQGIIIATLTHALFNIFIQQSNSLSSKLFDFLIIALLILSFWVVMREFQKLRKLSLRRKSRPPLVV